MNRQKITSRQALLPIVTITCTSVLQPSFRNLIYWTGNGGWVPVLLALFFGLSFLALFLKLARRFPKESIAEYAPRVLTRPLGSLLILILLTTFFLRSAFALRNVSEFFVAAILPETPISAVILIMLSLITAAIWVDLEGIVRFNELAIMLIVAAFLIVFVGTRYDGYNLLPLLDKGWGELASGFFSVASDLTIIAYLLFIYPFLVDPEDASSLGRRYLGAAGLLLLFIYLNTLLFLGSTLGATFTWPYLVLTENLWLIERGEALFMVAWTLAAFLKISFCLYISALGLSQLFPTMKLRWTALFLIPAVSIVALAARNLPAAIANYTRFNQAALFVQLMVPIITFSVALLRRLEGSPHE